MSSDEYTPSGGLVPSQPKELTVSSAALVRRTLDDIARMIPSPEEIEDLLSAFRGLNLDAYARAAKELTQLAPYLNIREDSVGELVFPIVAALERFFPRDGDPVLTSSCRGERYFPPNDELRRLLIAALESLVGPVSQPIEAIIAAFERGGRLTRIVAAGWLPSYDIPNAVSLLQDALAHTDDEFFALELRYQLVRYDKEDFDTIVHAFADHMARSSSRMEQDWCGQALFELGFPLSPDSLGRLVCTLGSRHDDHARSWAVVLLDQFTGGADQPQDEEEGIKRLKDCSEAVLEGLTRTAWHQFLRENDLHEPYVSLPVGARGQLLNALQHLIQQNHIRWDLDKASGSFPRKRDLYRDLCRSLRQLLEHAQARGQIDEYTQAITTAPDDPAAHRSLAQALRTAGFTEDAILHYREVVRLKPLDYRAHEDLASALETARLLDDAIEEYAYAVKLSPSSFLTRRHLIHALRDAGMFDRAVNESHQLLAFAQRSNIYSRLEYMAYYELGRALHTQGALEDAIPHYTESLRLRPDTPGAHYFLAQCLQELGRRAEALSHFQTAADLGFSAARVKVFQCKDELNKPETPM